MKKHKRRYILTILISSVVLSLAAAVLYGIYDAQQKESLRRDIQTTHSSLGTIAGELEYQNQAQWRDESECYQIAPRLFGEEYKYACEIRYSLGISKINLEGAQKIAETTTINSRKVDFGKPHTDMTGEYTSFLATIELEHKSGSVARNCSLEYVLKNTEDTAKGTLLCYYSLTKKQFDAVSGVLKTGPDRT